MSLDNAQRNYLNSLHSLNIYGLLTKREVKMAGYWPSSFFACLCLCVCFLRQIKFTKLVKLINICSLFCFISFASRPISLLSDFLLLEIDRKSLCYFGK